MTGVLGAAFVEVVLITYRGLTTNKTLGGPIKGLPLPADYVGAVVIFGGLSLLGNTSASGVASVFGWGLVVATALNLWTPNSPTSIGKKAKAAASPPPAKKVSAA